MKGRVPPFGTAEQPLMIGHGVRRILCHAVVAVVVAGLDQALEEEADDGAAITSIAAGGF
jgi:hypothetical protein